MKNCCVRLNDLPEELLLIIFRQLNNIDLLYSILGIDRQLNRILNDSFFTNDLRLVRSSVDGVICPLSSEIVDRFCLEILPKINEKIQSLTVESLYMENIFRAGDYLHLRKLCLASVKQEKLSELFNGAHSMLKKFRNTIRTFCFSIADGSHLSDDQIAKLVFGNVFKLFTNLTVLQFITCSNEDIFYLPFADEIPMYSATLLELHVNVETSVDFLCLLDGRLSHLHSLYVDIQIFFRPSVDIDMKKKVANLKKFSLIGRSETWFYNEAILPILHRMPNLEGLFLSLIIDNKQFLDGNRLHDDIINDLPMLNQFTFDIHSRIYDYKPNDIRSNEDLHRTFERFSHQQIVSCVDYFPEENFCQYHCYSYPYTMTTYQNITNNFPGGLFPSVRQISLFDEHPYEHQFFLRLSKAFPFLRELKIENFKAQNEKSSDNEDLPRIEYSSMTKLCLFEVHDHYIEQFLLDSKAFFPNSLDVSVHFHSLERVTDHFTRARTRLNAAKIKHLFLVGRRHEFSQDFEEYFPFAKKSSISL